MSSGTVYQISSKSDDFSLRYGDLSIFKMTAVRHLGFYKFAVFIMWPLSVCHSASSYKISLKSDNPSKSYGQKSDFKDGGRRHLEFKKKIQFLVTWLSSGLIFAVVYQMSSKPDNLSLRYGDLVIFNIAAVRHLGFVMTSHYCIAGHVFVVQILSWTFKLIGFVSLNLKALYKSVIIIIIIIIRDTCNIICRPFGCTQRTTAILRFGMRCITWPLVGGPK